ncbi:hypothetical protein EDD21DRAFT_101545 [Dissophora ornata]|nr:hypothetical protein EDD21DRAFT_101545 [Dissophora ornata]
MGICVRWKHHTETGRGADWVGAWQRRTQRTTSSLPHHWPDQSKKAKFTKKNRTNMCWAPQVTVAGHAAGVPNIFFPPLLGDASHHHHCHQRRSNGGLACPEIQQTSHGCCAMENLERTWYSCVSKTNLRFLPLVPFFFVPLSVHTVAFWLRPIFRFCCRAFVIIPFCATRVLDVPGNPTS